MESSRSYSIRVPDCWCYASVKHVRQPTGLTVLRTTESIKFARACQICVLLLQTLNASDFEITTRIYHEIIRWKYLQDVL